MSAVEHTDFRIVRDFKVPPPDAFRAWSEPELKRRWFVCDDEMVVDDYRSDFRVGGQEINRVTDGDGNVHLFSGRYFDIVAPSRIVYAYSMHTGDTRLSASLATVQFDPVPSGTRMIFTEQLVLLDGHQNRAERIRGTELGIGRLVALLDT